MLVIPAIDIRGGKCVRLDQGNFSKETVYHDDPFNVARKFVSQGAKVIHVVDLDGAKLGRPVNQAAVWKIASAFKPFEARVQVSGGIRSIGDVRDYLDGGVERILLGTALVENPGLLKQVLDEYGPDRVAVSVDVKYGRLATRGWLKQGAQTAEDIVPLLKQLGVSTVAVTDVSRDGLLAGIDLELPRLFIEAKFITIAAGGVTTLKDVAALNKLGAQGAIIGKALYENALDLPRAIEAGWRHSKLDLPWAIGAGQRQNKLAKRIIPCLDVKGGRVVKGTHFKQLRDAGDPVEMGKLYSDMGADELVFLDIAATLENRKTFVELVERIARNVNIPFTVGGGISSVKDIDVLLRAGADKVSIGTAAILSPEVVKEASEYFGSQCIVISVDAKRRSDSSGWQVYIKGGTQPTERDAVEFSVEMEQKGAGELLVNSLDRDGVQSGFDVELLKEITAHVNIPVIASSGAGSTEHFSEVFRDANVDAALGATVFHYGGMKISKLKWLLALEGLPVRYEL